jgi:hypothetical protein
MRKAFCTQSHRDDDLLRVVNPSTGGTISSVAITLAGKGVPFANGLATNPVTGELFALLKLDGQTGWSAISNDQPVYRCCHKYR